MPYEIVYHKETRQILAARRTAAPREDVVLTPEQAVLFTDVDLGERPLASFLVDPDAGTVAPRADWTAPETGVRLELSVDTPAVSPIDGTAELPADGKAQATITVRKRSLESDRDLTGAQHDNLLTIRTTAGTLSRRQVSLRRGKAKFTLRSSVETVVAEVRVSAETIPQAATIRVEFAPPD
jgi:hypothetical protein